MSVHPRLSEAITLVEAGHADRAAVLLNHILQEVPGEPDALQLLGMIARSRSDNTSAADYFRRSLVSRPHQPKLLNTLGNALLDLGHINEAVASYQRAVNLMPDFSEALTNLGLAWLEGRDHVQARTALEQAVRIDRASAKAWAALGRAFRGEDRLKDALAAFRTSLSLRPQHVPTLHNYAVALRLSGDAANAAVLLSQCAAADQMSAEIRYNLGHCHYDLGQFEKAAAAYRAAITRDPGARDAHDALNRLYWQTGNLTDYLASYAEALERDPDNAGLLVDLANRLNLGGRVDQARVLLEDALARGVESASVHEHLGQCLVAQDRPAEALTHFRDAIVADPDATGARLALARTLIVGGDYAAAIEGLDVILAGAPFDQQALALLAQTWRLMGDPRALVPLDYGRFIQVRSLQPPPGLGDTAAFNRRLDAALTRLHLTSEHPLEQTVRGGTQTMGELFDSQILEIQAVRVMIEAAVRDYIAALPDDADHPFLCRKSGGFRISGSWSVRLRSQGFHLNHVHSEGWISSVYYVALPPAVDDPQTQAGWIKFGETNLGLAELEAIGRTVQPQVGMLVLFPSYFYHGTIPFVGEAMRTTIAFDIVPD